MPPGKSAVKYDLAAASDLESALTQLLGKLDAFIGQREADRRTLLGTTPCDKWSGKKRATFDHEFAPEQRALHDLRDLVARQRGLVTDATNEALAAIAKSHGRG